MTVLMNKDVVSQSIQLPDIVNSLFWPPYTVSALTSTFSLAALLVEKISMLYLSSTTPTAK